MLSKLSWCNHLLNFIKNNHEMSNLWQQLPSKFIDVAAAYFWVRNFPFLKSEDLSNLFLHQTAAFHISSMQEKAYQQFSNIQLCSPIKIIFLFWSQYFSFICCRVLHLMCWRLPLNGLSCVYIVKVCHSFSGKDQRQLRFAVQQV